MNEERFTIASLAEGKSSLVEITPIPTNGSAMAALNAETGGIGIAIENFASFPDAENYQEHEFYRNNFSSSEIEYCLKQPSIKGSFGRLWAAKEAITKSEAAKASSEGFRAIEINHDANGKPTYPGCLLSVGHTDTIVVAVCFCLGSRIAPPAFAAPTPIGEPVKPATVPRKLSTRLLAVLALLTMLFVFGAGLWMILNLAFH